MSAEAIAVASPAEKIRTALALLGKNDKSPVERRTLILGLEAALMSMSGSFTQAGYPTRHEFAPGIYLRGIEMPKGMVLTSRTHKTEHFCVLSKGDVSVYNEDGMKRFQNPHIFHSMPGTKRVLFAHEDSFWLNVHHNPTNERDIDVLEKQLCEETMDQIMRDFEAAQDCGRKGDICPHL